MSGHSAPREARPFATLPGGLAPLGYRDYLLFWIGFAVSNAGRWVEMTGSLWLVSELSDSPILLGGLGMARAIPAILLSPFAGVIADRIDQRRLLLVTQASSLVLSCLLAAAILAGTVEIWQIYLQLVIQSCIQPFDLAARQTLFPRLVPRVELANAVTLTVAAARVAKFVGPAIGGIMIATLGEAAPYVFNAASFLVLMVAVVAMRPAPLKATRVGTTFAAEMREGLAEIRRTPIISAIFQLEAVFGLLQVNQVMITIVARDILGTGPAGLGLLLAAPAFGSIIGLIALVAVGQVRRQGRVAIISIAVYSAFMLLVATSFSFALTFVALAATGLLDAWVTVVRHGILQLSAPPAMRGRVMANMAVVSTGIAPLSQVGSGVLTGLLGAAPAIAAMAVTLAIVSTAIARRDMTLWRFEHRASVLRRDPPDDRGP